MLNIVVPMAGRGQRFVDAGYVDPKPLIPVHGQPMIHLVIENLRPSRPHRFIFLALAEHVRRYNLEHRLRRWSPGCEVIVVDHVTEGAACTVLLAQHLIDNHEPLMVANCDQYLDVDMDDYLAAMGNDDGLVMTMWADDEKWSFVKFDENDHPAAIVEKQVVSNEATAGMYNFRRGADFVWAAHQMIRKDLRVNGEFYVAPVYNELIERGRRIALYNIGAPFDGMYGLGTPEDLEAFMRLDVLGSGMRRAA